MHLLRLKELLEQYSGKYGRFAFGYWQKPEDAQKQLPEKALGDKNPLPEPEYNPGCDDRTVISPYSLFVTIGASAPLKKVLFVTPAGLTLAGLYGIIK